MRRPERERPEGEVEQTPQSVADARREAARARAAASLAERLCLLACSGVEAQETDRLFLKAVLDSLGVDRAAILKHLSGQDGHFVQDSIGFRRLAEDGLNPPHPRGGCLFVTPDSPDEPLVRDLRQAVGASYILWVLDAASGKSLLLGNATPETRQGFGFDESCSEMAETTLDLYLGLIGNRQTVLGGGADTLRLAPGPAAAVGDLGSLRSVLQDSSDVIAVIRADWRIATISQSVQRILEYEPDELLGRDGLELVHPDDRARIRRMMAMAQEGAMVGGPVELQVRHANGSWRFFECFGNNLLADRTVAGVVVTCRDITERKLLEEERQKLLQDMGDRVKELCCLYEVADVVRGPAPLEEVFQKVAALIPAGCHQSETALGRVVFDGNEYVSQPVGELSERLSSDVIAGGLRRGAVEIIRPVQAGGEEGAAFLAEERDLLDAVARTLGEAVERRRTEQRLQFSLRLLEIANRSTRMGPLLEEYVDEIGKFTGCSAVGIRLLNDEDNIPYYACQGFPQQFHELEGGLSIHDEHCLCSLVIRGDIDARFACYSEEGCFHVNSTSRFLAAMSDLEREGFRGYCHRFGYESVGLVPIRTQGRNIGLVHVADERQDMLPLEAVRVLFQAAMQLGEAINRVLAEEARTRAERQLEEQRALSIASDRLRSLGQMAAGIAHELNQPLVGVRGLAEHITIGLARGWDLPDEEIRKKLQLIVEQSERMSHIIDHVRVFAKEAGRPEMQEVRVNDVVLASAGLVQAQLRARGMDLKYGLTEDLSTVWVNPFSLEEVLLNLISNARDALQERRAEDPDAPALEIILRTWQTGEGPDKRVMIDVVDRGSGIREEFLGRVFDPFFTTKGPDRGVGLGLAVSKSIVEEFGGTIEIRSTQDQGTTVTIALRTTPPERTTSRRKHG